MNITRLRRKRVILPTVATLAVLGVGGTAWAATAAGNEVGGDERDRVGAAATEAVGGTVVDVETSDDPGEAYEVELRLDDGREADVTLDEDLDVVAQDTDDSRDDDSRDDDGDDRDGASDADDRALSTSERSAVEKAATDAVGGGTVLDAEASDDGSQAYEVEVRDAEGAEWDVDLDADFQVLHKRLDR